MIEAINPDCLGFFVTDEAIAELSGAPVDEIMLASAGEFSPPNIKWLAISSGSAPGSSRMKLSSWDEYTAMRLEGEPGGLGGRYDFAGAVLGDQLVFPPTWGHPVVFDSLSTSVRDAANRSSTTKVANGTQIHTVQIIAASAQYLLLTVPFSLEERFSRRQLDSASTDVFVHDRVKDRWNEMQIEGNQSRHRLFGSWLATTVAMFNPDNKPSPGRENERGAEAFGDYGIAGSKGNPGNARFPVVRGQFDFASFQPGVLILQNLQDGRKIRIETGQEDSEPLNVNGDVVLYRINDGIYQAKIVGNKLQGIMLLVKDEDVPEIHWVFWSN